MFAECSYRYRFYPTPAQAAFLSRTFGCVRAVYNMARAEREAAWKERKESCGFVKTNAMLTRWKKSEEFSWLNGVSSVPLQQCLRHLDQAYSRFFKKLSRYPGFRSKKGKQSAEFTKSGFSYRDGKIFLAKMAEPLDIVWSRDLPSEPSTVTISKEPDGRWYIACRVQKECERLQGGGSIGIDLGLKDLVVLSTGEKISNPRHISKRQRQLARAERVKARRQKGSNRRNKARLRVARLHAAVRHSRQDFLHKLSSRLIRENQAVFAENLSIKGMMRAKRHSRSIGDAGWGELVRQLTYKAMWYGRTFQKIDRFFPSTKTCSGCGTTGHVLTLSDRAWSCPDCGATHDRDVNAARNILAAGQAVSARGRDVRPAGAKVPRLPRMKREPGTKEPGIPVIYGG